VVCGVVDAQNNSAYVFTVPEELLSSIDTSIISFGIDVLTQVIDVIMFIPLFIMFVYLISFIRFLFN